MYRKYLTVTVFFNFLLKVCSKLSPEQIMDVSESIIVDESRKHLLRSSIVNPVFGYLFESTGALNNIRFYGPEMKIEKQEGIRNYVLDSSEDDIVKLAIELFPSPTGTLCHIRAKKDNFGFLFKNNIDEGIQFMSEMFISVVKNKECASNDKFRMISDILQSNKNSLFNDSKMIKLIMIHSFMINALNEKDHLKVYLDTILKSDDIFNELESFKLDNENVIEEVLKIRKQYLGFPYSELNQPPSNSVIPIYDRKNNTFSDKRFFSDCADICLMNICNCLLYDPERLCYSLEGLAVDSDIYRFYSKHNEIFTVTDEIRKDWSKVIQGLDDFNNSQLKLNKIVYLKEKRNEVDTGIINMLNVLIKIFNINHEEFWCDLKILTKIHSLFSLISRKGDKITVESKDTLSEVDLGDRIEIFGSFDISFDFKDTSIKLKVKQTSLHADIAVIEYTNKLHEVSKSRVSVNDNLLHILYMNFLKNCIEINDPVKRIYFSNYIQTNEQKRECVINILDLIAKQENIPLTGIFKRIIDSILGTVNLNDRGTWKFFRLCLVYFDNLTETDIIDLWIVSLHNENKEIYKLWEQRALETKIESATLWLSLMPRARIGKVFELLNRIESLKSLNIESIPEYFFTEEFSPELPSRLTDLKITIFKDLKIEYLQLMTNTIVSLKNLQSLDIAFLSSTEFKGTSLVFGLRSLKRLRKLKIQKKSLGREEIDCLVSTLTHLRYLQSLGISGQISDQFEEFTSAIARMTQLTELSINDKPMNESEMKCFTSAISNLSNLKVLDISKSKLESTHLNEFACALGKLPILEELNLSRCSLTKDELKSIVREVKNIENLNISFNRLFLEDLASILSSLHELNNLRSLNISQLNIKTIDLEAFSVALGNFTELRELDISKCKMNDKNSRFILEAISRLSNLEILNISQFSLTKIKSEYLQESIKGLKKLKVLNMEGWEYNHADMQALSLELPNLNKIIY